MLMRWRKFCFEETYYLFVNLALTTNSLLMIKNKFLISLLFLFFFILNHNAQEKIIVKFNYSYLDYELIDDENIIESKFTEIFNDKAKRTLGTVKNFVFLKTRELKYAH